MEKFCVEFGLRRRIFDHCLTLKRGQAEKTGEIFLEQEQAQAGKLTLILDLDETLVYMKCARGCLVNCSCGEGDEFYLAKRPGVDAFLSRMAELYEVVLWTASPQAYADAALEVLDPNKEIFSSRLYRQHLDASNKKDLSRLGRDLSRVIVVDDCVANFPEQLLPNVIRIKRFVADGSGDDQLETKLLQLLVELADVEDDVRKKVEQQRVLESQRMSSSAPWCPSWRKSNHGLLAPVVAKVPVEDPVYTPAENEKNMGEPSLLFQTFCTPWK